MFSSSSLWAQTATPVQKVEAADRHYIPPEGGLFGVPKDINPGSVWVEFTIPLKTTSSGIENYGIDHDDYPLKTRRGYMGFYVGGEPLAELLKEDDGTLMKALKSVGLEAGYSYNGSAESKSLEDAQLRFKNGEIGKEVLGTTGIPIKYAVGKSVGGVLSFGFYLPVVIGKQLLLSAGLSESSIGVHRQAIGGPVSPESAFAGANSLDYVLRVNYFLKRKLGDAKIGLSGGVQKTWLGSVKYQRVWGGGVVRF